MSYTVFNQADFPRDGSTIEWQGFDHADISIIWVDMSPGETIRLHKHPYQEVFIILEGTSTLIVGTETVIGHAGQVIVVDADVPHGFTNNGDVRLKQIDIHLNKEFITDWL